MQRYIVNFQAPSVATRRLLIPFSELSTVRAFASELQQRLARLGVTVEADSIVFRLDDSNGPEIDVDDTLEDIVLNPRSEQLFGSVLRSISRGNGDGIHGSEQGSTTTSNLDFVVRIPA
jgi:hypothetical protein